MKKIFLFVLIQFLVFGEGFGENKHPPIQADPGKPLFLTPLIKAGKIQEAKNASYVHPMKGQVQSYSGFLTVQEQYNSNMFFWFFPAQTQYEKAPVVLWLQGGPGASSLYGLFSENGPLIIHHTKLRLREYSWTRACSMLYIDNPVGTGFSFTKSEDGYAKNETAVGRDLYSALIQFFQLFPELQSNDFYVTGESYGGKYVPAIAYTIDSNNPSAKLKINLKGLAIGNGLSDPENQMNYGDYLYQIGLIDSAGKDLFQQKENEVISNIHQNKWEEAARLFEQLLNGDSSTPPTLFQNLTGFTNYYNFLQPNNSGDGLDYFMQQDFVRKAIHVGDAKWNDGTTVQKYLRADIMQSVRPWVEKLLEKYRVLVYNGQLDIIVAYPLTVNYLKALKWSAAGDYKTAPRKIWKVDGVVAGYSKTAGKLTELLVRDASHMVPFDQPKYAFDLISRFVSNKPFN